MIMVIMINFLVINVVKSIKKKPRRTQVFFPYLFAQHRNYMVHEVRNSFFEKQYHHI